MSESLFSLALGFPWCAWTPHHVHRGWTVKAARCLVFMLGSGDSSHGESLFAVCVSFMDKKHTIVLYHLLHSKVLNGSLTGILCSVPSLLEPLIHIWHIISRHAFVSCYTHVSVNPRGQYKCFMKFYYFWVNLLQKLVRVKSASTSCFLAIKTHPDCVLYDITTIYQRRMFHLIIICWVEAKLCN